MHNVIIIQVESLSLALLHNLSALVASNLINNHDVNCNVGVQMSLLRRKVASSDL